MGVRRKYTAAAVNGKPQCNAWSPFWENGYIKAWITGNPSKQPGRSLQGQLWPCRASQRQMGSLSPAWRGWSLPLAMALGAMTHRHARTLQFSSSVGHGCLPASSGLVLAWVSDRRLAIWDRDPGGLWHWVQPTGQRGLSFHVPPHLVFNQCVFYPGL